MAAVHAHGIVHRDLKPENLHLVPDLAVAGGERVKVLDFEIAKLVDPRATRRRRQMQPRAPRMRGSASPCDRHRTPACTTRPELSGFQVLAPGAMAVIRGERRTH
ncbi:MAG: hypothetical protein H7287_13320 [Thermoleophilia bacterium]|nr:hypothetical protein [Thermoleophilia bacterium]